MKLRAVRVLQRIEVLTDEGPRHAVIATNVPH
jgi:hypothetical protein